MVKSSVRFAGTILILSRIVYAANWYNLSPAITRIEATFGIPLPATVYIFTFFLIGAGIFQVPAGIISSRIGAKTTAFLGILVMGISDIVAPFSPNYYMLLALRAANGVGAALFFSTAMAVLSQLYHEKVTEIVTIYNAAFNVGGGIGIIGFAFIVSSYSWQADELIMGIITIVFAVLILVAVPESEKYTSMSVPDITTRIRNRSTWAIAIAFSGFWAASYLLPEYLKNYSISIGFSPFASAVLGATILLIGVLGIQFVRAFRLRNLIRSASYMTILVGAFIVAIPYFSYIGTWSFTVILGILFVVVSSLEYSAVIAREKTLRYRALSLGLFNSIQISIGSLISVVFSYTLIYGYNLSFGILGILVLLLLPVVIMSVSRVQRQTSGPI